MSKITPLRENAFQLTRSLNALLLVVKHHLTSTVKFLVGKLIGSVSKDQVHISFF